MHMVRSLKIVVMLILVAVAFAGCSKNVGSAKGSTQKTGAVESGSAVEEVKAVVNKYHQAIMDKNLDAAKALLSSDEAKKKLESMIDFRSSGMKRGGLPKILETKVEGNTAVVTCQFGPAKQGVDLVKVDGKWLVK